MSSNASPVGNWVTRHTLLQRACDPQDEKAWDEFIEYYERFVKVVIHKITSVNSAEADDLSQDIMLKLWKNLKVYDPEKAKFRTWMTTVIRNTIFKQVESTHRRNEHNSIAAVKKHKIMEETPTEIEVMIEEEWKNHISNLAMDKCKAAFSKNAIQVFTLSLQGLSNEDISMQLNVTAQSVTVLKSRVKKHFIAEIRLLVQELESP